MTKLFLSVVLCFATSSIWACNLQPMPRCSKLDIKMDRKKLQTLKQKLLKYESTLNQHQVRPKEISSCYGSYFGGMYVDFLIEELRASKGRTCKEQISQTWSAVTREVSSENEMFQTVTDKNALESLKKLRTEIMKDGKTLSLY